MKNKLKVLCFALAMAMLTGVLAGCSGGSTASSEASAVSSESSVEESSEESSEESIAEASEESSEEAAVSVEESSSESSSDSSAIDPSVEERSYNDEEKYEMQSTKIPNFKYTPYDKSYVYAGAETKVTIPSDFTVCPIFPSETSLSVEEIIVPETVTKIPTSAFGGCKNLKKLVILNPDCEIEKTILPSLDVEVHIYFMSDKTAHDENKLAGWLGDSATYQYFSKYFSHEDLDYFPAENLIDIASESSE